MSGFLWTAALLVLLPRAAAGVTAATAACRVLADVHWLSDTAAGAALGVGFALALAAATQAYDEESEAQ